MDTVTGIPNPPWPVRVSPDGVRWLVSAGLAEALPPTGRVCFRAAVRSRELGISKLVGTKVL